jgi:magnesium-transporting ATPase (P-type)
MGQFYFGLNNLFSRQSFYNDWAISFFNASFTTYALIFYATFEKDINSRSEEKMIPETFLYFFGKENLGFRKFNFIGSICTALVESFFIYFFIYFLEANTLLFSSFRSSNYEIISTLNYAVIIFQVQIKICLNTQNYNIIVILGYLIFGIGIYISYAATGHMTRSLSFYETGEIIWMNYFYYTVLIFLILVLFLINFLVFQIR